MVTFWDKDNADDEQDEDEDEDTKEENEPQQSYKAPKTNAGKGYPDEDEIDRQKPPAIRVSECKDENGVTKKVFMWEDTFWDSDEPLTKREFAEKFQMFWDEAKKDEQIFRESKKEDLTTAANRELNQVFERKMKSGEESRFGNKEYKQELDKLMNAPQNYSQAAKENILQNAFKEIIATFEQGNMISAMQKNQMLVANCAANKPHEFFRKRSK